MDTTDIHYLTFDPEAIYREMMQAYMDSGGDGLYPGDEKEMLLRAVQSILVQSFAGVDNALRMSTLRYAVGEYLDVYGENRGCARIEARKATAVVEIRFRQTTFTRTIKAGSLLTADGEHVYVLDRDVFHFGIAGSVRVPITAEKEGSAGNGLTNGTQMQFLIAYEDVEGVFCVEDAHGGQERENDDAYRERIRTFGLAGITTGPKSRYEAAAKNASSQVLDANAIYLGPGEVGIILLLDSQDGAETVRRAVEKAVGDQDSRPLTDHVSVSLAEDIPYTLQVQYKSEQGSDISDAVGSAVVKYQKWQDETIGRPFNPDKLMAMIYEAGAVRVIWGDGSDFQGGNVEYTEIGENKRCKGTITLEEIV